MGKDGSDALTSDPFGALQFGSAMSITEIANFSGVSIATVSRVVNNSAGVNPITAEAVRKAISHLGYEQWAIRLRQREGPERGCRRMRIAFIVPGTFGRRVIPKFEELVAAMSSAADEAGASFTLAFAEDAAALGQQVAALRADGLILSGDPRAELLKKVGSKPCVWVMGAGHRPSIADQILPDSYAIGELAAEHLLAAGHTRLAFVNLEPDQCAMRARGLSFSSAAQRKGVSAHLLEPASASANDPNANWPPEVIAELAARFAALSPRPTGLLIPDDAQTAAIQPALVRAGVPLGPGGTEIISVNQDLTYLTGLEPRPVSIDASIASIGSRAVEQLLWRMSHPTASAHTITLIAPHLPIRARADGMAMSSINTVKDVLPIAAPVVSADAGVAAGTGIPTNISARRRHTLSPNSHSSRLSEAV